MPFDLILRGGRVVDPSQRLDAVTDVAFASGKVAAIGSELRADPGTDVRKVSGHIVTPGLIDLHTHVYWGGTSLGIDAEEFCRSSGVTTAVDTGSAGPGNFAGFRKHVIEPSEVRILAYLHVSHAGIFGFSNRVMVGESEELRLMDPISAAEVADQNRDLIVGIKVRVGLHASGKSGIVPLDIALEVAEQVGLDVVVLDDRLHDEARVRDRLRVGDDLDVLRVDLGFQLAQRLLDGPCRARGRLLRAREQQHPTMVCRRRGKAAGNRAAADYRKSLLHALLLLLDEGLRVPLAD